MAPAFVTAERAAANEADNAAADDDTDDDDSSSGDEAEAPETETEKVGRLERELEEARKAHRALARKLIADSGIAGGAAPDRTRVAEELAARGAVARLENDLDEAVHILGQKDETIAQAGAALRAAQKAADEAAARAADEAARRDRVERDSEQELERLQQELHAAQLRADRAQEQQQADREARKAAERAEREATESAVAAAQDSWRQQQLEVEENLRKVAEQAKAEAARLREDLTQSRQTTKWASELEDKYAVVHEQERSARAEFERYKQMTQRKIKAREDEIARLQEISAAAPALKGRGAGAPAVSDEESLRLRVEQELAQQQKRREMYMLAALAFVTLLLSSVLYRLYQHSGGAVCALARIGVIIGSGCLQ